MTDREQGVSADLLEQQLRWVADPANGVASLTVYVEPANCRAILAALADAARLDWLEAGRSDFVESVNVAWLDGSATLRAAIDAARAAEGETP